MKKYSPLILRIGLVFVFIWFGTNQILNQSMWVSLIPSWAISASGMTAKSLVVFNGVFEIVMAVLLSFGIWIRVVSALLFLHLAMIVGDLGLNAIGVRDVGLMFAVLSVLVHGADDFSYDRTKVKLATTIINQ